MSSPLISKPSALALAVGSVAFAGLYWLSSAGLSAFLNWWFYPAPPDNLAQSVASSPVWRLLNWSLYLVPGFVAGLLARRSGLMHGAIVGVLTAPIMALLIYALGFWSAVELSSLVYGAVLGLVWCSLAGLIGELIGSRVWPQ